MWRLLRSAEGPLWACFTCRASHQATADVGLAALRENRTAQLLRALTADGRAQLRATERDRRTDPYEKP
ncbi:MAG: hypothetical protein AB1941_05830 [Gemmatimonadota bacterium]